MYLTKDTENFFRWLLEKARNLRLDAGYGGEMHDRGASRIEDVVDAYQKGLHGDTPANVKALASHYQEWESENDEDWKEFLRLKEKFKDK